MFLDFAEDRALRRIETRMTDWLAQTDRFLNFNERAVLEHAGRISHEQMEVIIDERYAAFDACRRQQEAQIAEQEAAEDLQQLKTEAARLIQRKKSQDKP